MQKHNLEIKYFSKDFEGLRATLTELGATHIITKHQKDFFFNLPNDKVAIGARMKLRVEDGTPDSLIYYERPDTLDAGVQADVKLIPANIETLRFCETAFGVRGIVEKQRELWQKDDVVFNLDTVTDVGELFEIELQKDEELTATDRDLFASYLDKCKPFLGEAASGSNIDLVSTKESC
ncbi:class IV adenylate cyclase [Candidatus Kaiserbacteria bacterium]|nr:class IV adenylate cyclase [Candidatus Kaiserbacteria bacterium]